MLNTDRMLIHGYNLNKQQFDFTLNIPLKFDEQISYVVLDKDSLYFISNPEDRKICCVNSKGEITQSWQITDSTKAYGKEYSISAFYSWPLMLDEKFIYTSYYPLYSLADTTNHKKYFTQPKIVVISKNNGSIVNEIIHFPEKYIANSYREYNLSCTMNSNNEIIVSFRGEDSVLLYNTKDKTYKYKLMMSSFFTMKNVYKEDTTMDHYASLTKYSVENSSYFSIQYDKFRKKYYRVCLHKYKYDNDDGTVNTSGERPWSIVVADSAFNIEKEIVFPRLKYNYGNILITSKGVLVSKSNAYNKNYKQNELNYDIFIF